MNLYLLDITEMPEDAVSIYTPLMDPDRRERIVSCRRLQDQKRSLAAGLLLHYAWRERFPRGAFPEVRRQADGKPYFAGCPVPFGLSHSGHYAACALADRNAGEVGLDIQEPRRILPGVIERFFSEGEKEAVRGGEEPILIWSRKESLAKYDGRGLRGDIRSYDTAACADGVRICSFRTADGYAVSVCMADDYAARGDGAVCAENAGGSCVRLVQLSWRRAGRIAEDLRATL